MVGSQTSSPSLPSSVPPVLQPQGRKIRSGRPVSPTVAIVIDDMGYRQKEGSALLDLDLALSFAFLPHGPHTPDLARRAQSLGRDILLHLPLQASDPRWDPGPGTLTLAMDETVLLADLDDLLAMVPMAIGVNNHMGSRFTEDSRAMGVLLAEIGRRRLFFLDSVTSSQSVGYDLARQLTVPTVRRNVFLDNEQDRLRIIAQLENLVAHAEKQGTAVGIGHPHAETLLALREFGDRFRDRVTLVGIGSLAH